MEIFVFGCGGHAKVVSEVIEATGQWRIAGYVTDNPQGERFLGREVLPFEDPDQFFPVHPELLAKNGVYILENMDTRALAADNVSEFLFVLGQPRFVGAVQAVINPIAIR